MHHASGNHEGLPGDCRLLRLLHRLKGDFRKKVVNHRAVLLIRHKSRKIPCEHFTETRNHTQVLKGCIGNFFPIVPEFAANELGVGQPDSRDAETVQKLRHGHGPRLIAGCQQVFEGFVAEAFHLGKDFPMLRKPEQIRGLMNNSETD